MSERKSLFSSLRNDIDRMLCALGLSHADVQRTHLGDNDLGGHDAEPNEAPESELLDSNADERGTASVPGVRPKERDEQEGRRVLPLDGVPLVRLAQRAEGDDGLRSLLIEADSAISHFHHRGVWPLDRYETDRLIGRLRSASR